MVSQDRTRLAFGCGNIDYHDKGYKNVDIRKFPHIDFVVDISNVLPWDTDSVDEILAESVLEHIPHGFMNNGTYFPRAHVNTIEVLKDWLRVLKPGGKCIIKVPNIKGIVNHYVQGKMPMRDFWMYIYGGQEYKENTHYCGFDPNTLIEVMQLAGFKDVVVRNAHNFNEPLDENNAWEMAGVGIK